MAFADREPAVLIVGAGQAGLAHRGAAAAAGVDTLVVDKLRAGGRRLAGALSLAGPAQPDQTEPPALSAVAAELAEVPAEGHDRRLARDLCLGDGVQRLDETRDSSAPSFDEAAGDWSAQRAPGRRHRARAEAAHLSSPTASRASR